MAHTQDHEDIEERKRRQIIMENNFKGKTNTIISGNNRADQLAKMARDSNEPALRVPLALHEDERFCISTLDGKKIFNVREYIRADLRNKYLIDAQKLTRMPWLSASNIHLEMSNSFLVNRKPTLAALQNFTLKMRRHQLYEKAMILKRLNEHYAYYPNPPENGRCEMCGKDEDWMHPMMHCNKTEHIRKDTRRIVTTLLQGLLETDENIPCWWAPTEAQHLEKYWENLEGFNKTWGALGIIPKCLLDVLQTRCPENKKEKIYSTISNIQILILMSMQDSWNYRCSKTKWQKRPPDRGNT